MSALFESVARIARHEAMARATAGVGTVEEVFDGQGAPPDHAITVKMRDSGLVFRRVPMAVGALGFAATPAVGDLVVVVFQDGDPNAPIVVGRLYHPGVEPPSHGDGELVLRLPPGERDPAIDVRVAAAEPVIRVALPGDVVIEVRDAQIELAAGNMKVTLRTGSGGRLTLAAGGTEISLAEDGDLTCKTSGKLKLEGNEVEIRGAAKVKIDGGQVEVN